MMDDDSHDIDNNRKRERERERQQQKERERQKEEMFHQDGATGRPLRQYSTVDTGFKWTKIVLNNLTILDLK